MKKKVLAVAGILGITLLTGCSGGNQASGTEITFWHSMGGKGGEAINKLVKEFNDIKIFWCQNSVNHHYHVCQNQQKYCSPQPKAPDFSHG